LDGIELQLGPGVPMVLRGDVFTVHLIRSRSLGGPLRTWGANTAGGAQRVGGPPARLSPARWLSTKRYSDLAIPQGGVL